MFLLRQKYLIIYKNISEIIDISIYVIYFDNYNIKTC
jgi:hypothetical protein